MVQCIPSYLYTYLLLYVYTTYVYVLRIYLTLACQILLTYL